MSEGVPAREYIRAELGFCVGGGASPVMLCNECTFYPQEESLNMQRAGLGFTHQKKRLAVPSPVIREPGWAFEVATTDASTVTSLLLQTQSYDHNNPKSVSQHTKIAEGRVTRRCGMLRGLVDPAHMSEGRPQCAK